jgi:hypothetical protein
MDFPEKAIIGAIGDTRGLIDKVKEREGTRVIGPCDPLDLTPGSLLVLDHALALCDRVTRGRAAIELARLRRAGASVLIASNDEELLEAVCDELWWLEEGRVKLRGAPEEVLRAYRADAAKRLRADGNGAIAEIAPAMRRGDGRARIGAIELLGDSGTPTIVWRSGEEVRVRVTAKFERPVDDPVVGMLIRTRIGLNVYGTNTELEQLRFGPCAANETVQVTFGFRCELCPGEYTLTIASHDPDGVWHEWLEDAVAFTVSDSRYTAGVANLRAKVDVVRQA